MMSWVTKAIGIIIALALALYLVPRLVSKSTVERAEAFITNTSKGPAEFEKTDALNRELHRNFQSVPHSLTSFDIQNENVVELHNVYESSEYHATFSSQVHFPQGLSANCLGPIEQRQYGCQFGARFPEAQAPIAPNTTVTLTGELVFKRRTPDEPWKGGVRCCMKRMN